MAPDLAYGLDSGRLQLPPSSSSADPFVDSLWTDGGGQRTPDGNGKMPRSAASTPAPQERDWKDFQHQHLPDQIPTRRSEDDSRLRPKGRSTSGPPRRCKKCGEQVIGQFVRALDGTFHIDCFTCRDCGLIVASKFFPAGEDDGDGQFPLCETDYFRRLGMLCYRCGGALRGSYITALDRKYHVDHFTCSLCPTIFGAEDSYYEHDGQVYCHHHYSTQYAQRCNGCATAILKQFVEILRNGQNQHWHPECYMIHKFWNVRLANPPETVPNQTPSQTLSQTPSQAPDQGSSQPPEPVQDSTATVQISPPPSYQSHGHDERMEEKMFRIWSVLSAYEESSAACISDMLLHVSNGSYVEGLIVAKRFIWHVEILFSATDGLDVYSDELNGTNLSYNREAKLLCKKIVSFFTLISKAHEEAADKLGVTQDLLSLVTGLAHYLKLLIRICLQGALRIERDSHSSECIRQFLDDLSRLGNGRSESDSLMLTSGLPRQAAKEADHCSLCKKSLDDGCAKNGNLRWHVGCVKCSSCGRDLGRALADARYNAFDSSIYCSSCTGIASEGALPFEHVTRLQQLIFLLRVAMDRLLDRLQLSSVTLPRFHPEFQASISTGEAGPSNRLLSTSSDDPRMVVGSGARSMSLGDDRRESTYEVTRDEIAKLRNNRLDRSLSSSVRRARVSRIMDRPEGRTVRPGSSGADEGGSSGGGDGSRSLHVVEDIGPSDPTSTEVMFGHPDGLTLDDIPRIVAAEQNREQYGNPVWQEPFWPQVRPEPSHVNGGTAGAGDRMVVGAGQSTLQPAGRDADLWSNGGVGMDSHRARGGRRFFSELSSLEYFAVRHLAVLAMQRMVETEFTQEELIGFIDQRKQTTFWKHLGKAFGKAPKKKGVFGVPLEAIIERDGADSTDGVGPGTLRVPAIVDNIITSMRQMDLSVEGMFRKNGNIKKREELVERIDRDGCDNINFMEQPVVQMATLLKQYLRDLPDPLMTQKLHKLWLAAARIPNEEQRLLCLHLACCLLPKCHRDCLEILFSFLKLAGSFHHVDEENGSRMDIRNIAIVIAPNILYSNTKQPALDNEPILAIDAVEQLILHIEEMCMVPQGLDEFLDDPQLSVGNGEITTKEMLKRLTEIQVHRLLLPSYDSVVSDAYSNRHGMSSRPPPRRIETDPALWQQETIVRAMNQDPLRPVRPYSLSGAPVSQPLLSPPAGLPREGSDSEGENGGRVGLPQPPQPPQYRPYQPYQQQQQQQNGGPRRDWRQSGWGRQNSGGMMGVAGNVI